MTGSAWRGRPVAWPRWLFGRRYWCRSLPHMPEAFISSTTSPGPGVGSGKFMISTARSPVKHDAPHGFLRLSFVATKSIGVCRLALPGNRCAATGVQDCRLPFGAVCLQPGNEVVECRAHAADTAQVLVHHHPDLESDIECRIEDADEHRAARRKGHLADTDAHPCTDRRKSRLVAVRAEGEVRFCGRTGKSGANSRIAGPAVPADEAGAGEVGHDPRRSMTCRGSFGSRTVRA